MMPGVPYLLSGLAAFWQQQQQQQQQQQPPLNLNPTPYRCSKCLAQRQPHRQSKGEVVCIPRLGITPSDSSTPFTLRTLHFPVTPAFATTINKSQGQTLKMVGVYLPKPVFCHGQLYVALSRVGSKQAVRVLVEGGWVNQGEIDDVPEGKYTANVVYRELLT
jgi:hypothetical protein